MTWPTTCFGIASLFFIGTILCFLLREKRIDSENTIRFACIGVVVLVIIIVAFVPIPNQPALSGIAALGGTALGYVIRDKSNRETQRENKGQN